MPNLQQAISVLLSATLSVTTIGLNGCGKKSAKSSQSAQHGQAPATTYATPTADQLSQLVAPIALFPDNLLAQVLAASTYPDQVTAAYQWVQQNSGLKGQQLMLAVDKQPWDASVKGLTQFPDVLQQMATNLTWTSALGDAYFNIPQSVMNAVQLMRQRAYQAGNLKSTPQQSIAVQNQAPGAAQVAPASSGQAQVTVVQPPAQTIVIQPAQPNVVYVPTYNPTTVYGAPVPAYPGYSTGEMVATSLLSFGVGIAVGAAISGGGCCGWGWNSWGCGWHNSTVVYNRNTYISTSNTFANRNNYYNRNYNNYNRNINNANFNNVNRNNINTNDINRNKLNANNLNRNNINANRGNLNNRTNNFSTPQFNQQRNQQQFRNQNAGNVAQQRNANQPSFNQQARGAAQANAGSFNQNQRLPERGYGQHASLGSGNSAFSNYSQGGNARTNSARGQQSLEGRSAAGAGGGLGGGEHASSSGGGLGAGRSTASARGGRRR